jgi:hypothetical protein
MKNLLSLFLLIGLAAVGWFLLNPATNQRCTIDFKPSAQCFLHPTTDSRRLELKKSACITGQFSPIIEALQPGGQRGPWVEVQFPNKEIAWVHLSYFDLSTETGRKIKEEAYCISLLGRPYWERLKAYRDECQNTLDAQSLTQHLKVGIELTSNLEVRLNNMTREGADIEPVDMVWIANLLPEFDAPIYDPTFGWGIMMNYNALGQPGSPATQILARIGKEMYKDTSEFFYATPLHRIGIDKRNTCCTLGDGKYLSIMTSIAFHAKQNPDMAPMLSYFAQQMLQPLADPTEKYWFHAEKAQQELKQILALYRLPELKYLYIGLETAQGRLLNHVQSGVQHDFYSKGFFSEARG